MSSSLRVPLRSILAVALLAGACVDGDPAGDDGLVSVEESLVAASTSEPELAAPEDDPDLLECSCGSEACVLRGSCYPVGTIFIIGVNTREFVECVHWFCPYWKIYR